MLTGTGPALEAPEWALLALFAALAGALFVVCGLIVSNQTGFHDFSVFG